MKRLIQFLQDRLIHSAQLELTKLASDAFSLAFKAGVDAPKVLLECKGLGLEDAPTSNIEVLERLALEYSWLEKAQDCRFYFSDVFFMLTSLSPPWKAWILERPDSVSKSAANKLLHSFLRICQGRNSTLSGEIEALRYEETLLKLWLELPPVDATKFSAEDKLEHREGAHGSSTKRELVALAAQARNYASRLRDAGIAVTSNSGLDEWSITATTSQVLSMIQYAPRWPEEQYASYVLQTSAVVKQIASRFFFVEQEEDLSEVSEEELAEILEARAELGDALHCSNICSISALESQISSTNRMIDLAQVLVGRIDTKN